VEISQASSESVGYVLPDGTRIWLIDRRLYHRVGAPAVVHPDGSEEWWHLGWLHRDDGPAILGPGTRLEWWHHGRPTWSDGERISPGLVRHDDYGCLGTGTPSSRVPVQPTVDLREIRLLDPPGRAEELRDSASVDTVPRTTRHRARRRA
jgi:hypothetical protein